LCVYVCWEKEKKREREEGREEEGEKKRALFILHNIGGIIKVIVVQKGENIKLKFLSLTSRVGVKLVVNELFKNTPFTQSLDNSWIV
jgi:hypothetical protein